MINKHYAGIFGALVIAVVFSAPGNAQQGVEAKLQICGSCHGAEGRPISPGIPIIWGQTEYFLTKQLHDYISGDRESPIMSSLAKALTQPELRPAAKYFSAKQWPAKTAQASAPATPEGIALCQICHQQGFVGGDVFIRGKALGARLAPPVGPRNCWASAATSGQSRFLLNTVASHICQLVKSPNSLG